MTPTPPHQSDAPQSVPPERALRPMPPDGGVSEDTTRELYTQLIAMLGQENAVEAQATRRFSLRSAGQVLRRRWLPMLIVFLAVGYGLSRVLKPGRPTFSATAALLLPPPSGPGSNQFMIDDGSDSATRQYDTEAQIAIITSPEIIARALKYLKPELRVAGWGDAEVREAGVTASAPISENIIDITAFSYSPEASQRLANAVGGVYKLEMEYRTQNARKKELDFVTQKAKGVSQELNAAKEKLRTYKEETGVYDLATQTSATSARVQQLQQRANDARLEANAGNGAPTIAGDSTLTALRQRADTARTAYENLNRDFQPTAPRVVKARQEWQEAESTYQQRLSSLQSTLQSNASQLESQLAQARGASEKLPTIEYNLGQLNARVDQLSGTYRTLSDRQTALNLAKNASVALPSFLRPAVPEGPSRFGSLRYLALSVLGALLLSVLAALLLEKMDRGIHSPADLQKLVDAPLLGALPALPANAERRLTHMASVGAKAEMLEACYALRSRLVDAAYKNSVRSLLVTSATTDDGKSLCALNVATALAYDGHRVLLVDSDFWNPTQHNMADVPLAPGYSELLQGQVSFDEAVKNSRVRNLWLLPSGARPENILELMESDFNRVQLQNFKDTFDFVIIDSPPTLSLADAQILSSLAEAVTLVVAESTPGDAVQRAQAVLRLTGSHVLGIILNNDKSGATFTSQASRALAPIGKVPPVRTPLQDGH